MTIIAVHNNVMVADSCVYAAGVEFPLPPGHRKISRLSDGSLFGAAGSSLHTQVAHRWAQAGMDFANPPTLPELAADDDNNLMWLWLRKDQRLFVGYKFDYHEVSQPDAIGYRDACNLWLGAVLATGRASEAIRIAIKQCTFIGGEPQIEPL